MEIKIATLNVCLGLMNKLILINNILVENEIDILCLQEVEIRKNVASKDLNIRGFNLELENNSEKSRTCIYVSNKIKYRRRPDLEGINSNIVIIDIDCKSKVSRVINLYRSFNPQDNVSARDKFKYQLQLIKEARTQGCVILGDFNLDYSRVNDVNYANRFMFDDLESILYQLELIQIVNFVTWSRLVGQVLRSSILDHIYIKDPTVVKSLKDMTPSFGDHLLIMFNVDGQNCNLHALNKKRDWRFYSKEILHEKLCSVDWNIDIDTVQEFWNEFEFKLISIIDDIVPLCDFSGTIIKEPTPRIVKNKINKRNRLLKLFKKRPNLDLKSRISNLNCEIRAHFFAKRKFKVRKGILPGNSKTLWSAVNIAKNNGHNGIPENMCQNNVPVVNISESFAEFFDKKVSNIVNQTVISDNVYSGRRKIHAEVEMFMTEFNIIQP